ncbi:CaiB/BaiF CoA transferase family protein [Paenibacillus chartarius]|uniref:CaiB/BaiF CoA transferase family protein n=1 Tax=Paenibacillus chartarius TaxID=747481 RepID=A0ABV6DLV2_9BACL
MDGASFQKPLEGILVLDFSQFLSGPSAALRLADLGARVMKIERPGTGDICRTLYISNLELDGDSTLFHSINRNKESFAADLKKPNDVQLVAKLIGKADVLIQNFRPGVMEKLGLDYETLKKINPRLVYGEITGYGNEGPWVGKPGQDLLVQSLSGMTWLNGNGGQPPTPCGLAIADMSAGAHLVQGILSGLVRRGITGEGCLVQVSLLESILDVQFAEFTTFLNDGGRLPIRSGIHNAHPYMAAPYGIYQTKDGFLALAHGSVIELGKLLGCESLLEYADPHGWLNQRDEIKRMLSEHLLLHSTREWLDRLEPAGYSCSEVLNWSQLMKHEGFQELDMIQEVRRSNGYAMFTTRCPLRIDGQLLTSGKGSPRIGEDNLNIRKEYRL